MKRIRARELKIGDTFKVEYGCYGNKVNATITNIEPTEYDHINLFTYTCYGEQCQDRMVLNNFVEV